MRRDAALGRLLDKIRNLVAQRIDLDREADIHALIDLHLDHAVEQRFPLAVAGKVVVGDEEALDTLGIVLAHGHFRDRRPSGPGSCGPAR